MTTTTTLVMVRVYLKQELPPPYNELIEIEGDRIVIKLHKNELEFNVNFDHIYNMIRQRIKNIRGRDYDLHFTVKGTNQLRDFTIYKVNSIVTE
jgi:hypothetical protein